MTQVTVKPRTRAGSYETFDRRYGIVPAADDNDMRDHYDDDCKAAAPRTIWTVLDCDGVLYVSPGAHAVNRIGFVITEREWSDIEHANPGYRW